MTKLLTEEEFKATFSTKMINVTETAEPVIDIWPYVEELAANNIVDKYVLENNLVEIVYRNETSSFDHVLLPTPTENVFIVIIVNLVSVSIKGYYPLNLNVQYV